MGYAVRPTPGLSRLFRRPELEALEDRCLPTTAIATGTNPVNTNPAPSGPVVTSGPVGSSFIPTPGSLNYLPANDDYSYQAPIGFSVNVAGQLYSCLYINTNGSITFGSSMGTPYTPIPLNTTNEEIIAPFFADVDTDAGPITQNGQTYANTIYYGPGTVNGEPAFAVTWDQVNYYQDSSPTSAFNTFQVVLIQRPDLDSQGSTGSFDFELNYNTITWEAGDASGGYNGLGGTTARVGYSFFATGSGVSDNSNSGLNEDFGTANINVAGQGLPTAPGTSYFEFPGSGVSGALLDSNDSNPATGLVNGSLNSSVPGQYLFHVPNGFVDPSPVFTTAPATVTVNQGATLSALFQAADPQQLPITYSLVPTPNPGGSNPNGAIPPGMQIHPQTGDPQTGVLTWPASTIPSEDQDTTYSVTVRATDSAGNFVDTNVLVTVHFVSQPPVFTMAPATVTVNQGATLSAVFQASDPQQQPITYSLVPTPNPGGSNPNGAIPSGMQINPQTGDPQIGVLTWPASTIPSEDQDTTYPVTVRATDSAGNFVDTNVLVTVHFISQPPVFTIAPITVTVKQGKPVSVSFQATDPQQLPITYSLVQTTNLGSADAGNPIPTGMQIDAQSGLLTWPAGSIPSEDQDTTYPVTVRATDSDGNSVDTNVLITVLTNTTVYKSTELAPGETGTITLPKGALTVTASSQTGTLLCGLGWYAQNPDPAASPGKQPVQAFIDVWVENPQLIGSMTLMVQTPPGSGPYVLRYLDQTGHYVSVPSSATISDNVATGVLTITFRPPFTEFGFTVFAVSVGNTVVQPTNVQPATAQANTNSDSVGDINPGVVQTLNFISTTQLTLTVSGAQDSQQNAAANSQGSRALSNSSVGRVVDLVGESEATADLERQAWWFQFGDDVPWYLLGPSAPAKPATPRPQPSAPGGNEESSTNEGVSITDQFMLQPREWTSLGVTARQLWPQTSERELPAAAPPAAICLDPVKPQEKPRAAAAAVTLPFLVLGERLAANYRDKERARQPDMFRKDAPSSRARKVQKKTRAQKKSAPCERSASSPGSACREPWAPDLVSPGPCPRRPLRPRVRGPARVPAW